MAALNKEKKPVSEKIGAFLFLLFQGRGRERFYPGRRMRRSAAASAAVYMGSAAASSSAVP